MAQAETVAAEYKIKDVNDKGEAVERTSTDIAPWYVVPADRKWYRNWAISTLLLEALTGLGLSWPAATFDVDAERRRLEAMP